MHLTAEYSAASRWRVGTVVPLGTPVRRLREHDRGGTY